MRRFILNRLQDPAGRTGVGHVADGVEFSGGPCVISWRAGGRQLEIYHTIDSLKKRYDPSQVQIVWIDLDEIY